MKPFSIAASSNPVVDEYIVGVLSGQVVACKWVRLAVERHVQDLETGHARGLHFDEERAQHVIDFFQFLKHSKGEWAGQVITLEPWQQFYLWVLFGWINESGIRRFKTSYLEVSRKNGKTTLLAGVGLYLLVADSEPGAEVYTAATKRDQARISHSEATRMVKKSRFLLGKISIYKDNLNVPLTDSKFEPLGRDSDTMDGLNVHGAVIDELHAHKTREVWDILDTATGSRRQPLLAAITTAGFDRTSICFEQHTYTKSVLDGSVEDDEHFGLIYTLDEDVKDADGNIVEPGDDWEDESTWIKANPNLGVSKKILDMRRKAKRAKEMPGSLNSFLRKELDIWTQSASQWMNMEKWLACGTQVHEAGLRGRRCFAGLDLSSTTDISALVLVFPPEIEEDPYQLLFRFFVPQEAMHIRTKRDRVPYETWVRQGFITATPGDVIDYKYIYQQFDEDAQSFDLTEIAFDRWGATKVYQDMEEKGATMIQFGQGFASMSAPMKELENLVLAGRIAHGNNPVANWMMGNVVAIEDPAGNKKPDKSRSREKIDGIVATIMGLDRAIRNEGDESSVYEERELRTL